MIGLTSRNTARDPTPPPQGSSGNTATSSSTTADLEATDIVPNPKSAPATKPSTTPVDNAGPAHPGVPDIPLDTPSNTPGSNNQRGDTLVASRQVPSPAPDSSYAAVAVLPAPDSPHAAVAGAPAADSSHAAVAVKDPPDIRATKPNTVVQSQNLKKSKHGTNLSQKRPAEDPDPRTGLKRGRHDGFLGLHAAKKNVTQGQRDGRGVLVKHPKKINRLVKEWRARKYGAWMSKPSHVATHKLNTLGSSKRDETRASVKHASVKGKGAAEETEEGTEEGTELEEMEEEMEMEEVEEVEEMEEMEEDDEAGEANLLMDSEDSGIDLVLDNAAATAAEDPSENGSAVGDDEESLNSMRVHDKADLDDLQRSLTLNSHPQTNSNRALQQMARLRHSKSQGPNPRQQGVAKQRAASGKKAAAKRGEASARRKAEKDGKNGGGSTKSKGEEGEVANVEGNAAPAESDEKEDKSEVTDGKEEPTVEGQAGSNAGTVRKNGVFPSLCRFLSTHLLV